jgi:hypothetical protein
MRTRELFRSLRESMAALTPEEDAAMSKRLHRAGEPRRLWGLCGARTRAGGACRARAARDRWQPWIPTASGRCRVHGGASTGPRTNAGRARIATAQNARWCAVLEAEGRRRPAQEIRWFFANLLASTTLQHAMNETGFSRRQLERLARGRYCTPYELAVGGALLEGSRPERPEEPAVDPRSGRRRPHNRAKGR